MAEALASLIAARMLVALVPPKRWLSDLGGDPQAPPLRPEQRKTALRAQRWVTRVAAHAPFRAVCLPQAVAARWMLRRRGIDSAIRIGAAPGEDRATRPIDLHAWLMAGDLCVTGWSERKRFAEFRPPSA